MFTIYKRELGDTAPFTYLPIKNDEPAVLGSVYKLTAGGALIKAAPTDKPGYLCLGVQRADKLAPMIKLSRDMQLCTSADVEIAQSLVGLAVTLGEDSATVSGNTTNGVFTLCATDGEAKSNVCGYFE